MCAQNARVIEKVLAQPNYESYFAGCMNNVCPKFPYYLKSVSTTKL